jgi:crossover junction endodeoxyribonuclease RuvC
MNNWIIGVDCGLSGGIALVDSCGRYRSVIDMPVEEWGKNKRRVCAVDLIDAFTSMRLRVVEKGETVRVYVERVSAMPGQGVTSMFSFGEGVGCVRTAIAASKLSSVWVTPNVWKKKMDLTKRHKDAAITLCREIFPDADLKKNKSGRADALMIARYGWLQESGTNEH